MKSKRRLIIWLLVVLMLLIFSIGGVICYKEYQEFQKLHPTHKDFEDHLIIGSTVEQIEELYGKFDVYYYFDENADGFINFNPQDPMYKDIIIRRGKYCLSEDPEAVPLLFYAVFFNEKGIATEVKLMEDYSNGI